MDESACGESASNWWGCRSPKMDEAGRTPRQLRPGPGMATAKGRRHARISLPTSGQFYVEWPEDYRARAVKGLLLGRDGSLMSLVGSY